MSLPYPVRKYQRALATGKIRGTLDAWEMNLAEWWAKETQTRGRKTLPLPQLVEQARVLCPPERVLQLGERFPEYIKNLHQRNKTYAAYRALWLTDVQRAMRKKIEYRLPRALDRHFDAIDRLYEAGEWKHIAPLTVPALDRAWPKKEDSAPVVAVQVVLSGKRQEMLDEALPEVEAEAIKDSDL